MKEVVFYRIIDYRNAGDMLCCPKPHFPEYQNSAEIDMRKWSPDPNRVSIFGGGGILYHELHDVLSDASQARNNGQTGPIIIWGAGENMCNQRALMDPHYLKNFDLVGLRDATGNRQWEYVPCVSCMIPGIEAFSKTEPVFPLVVYDHFGAPTPVGNIAPKLTNMEGVEVDVRMRFLSMGREVLTNSYHGAYWAMLMGRPVTLYAGPSVTSRYFHFKYPPKIITNHDAMDLSGGVKAPPEYLRECRELNCSFHKKVLELCQ